VRLLRRIARLEETVASLVGALADLTKDVDNIAIHCKARFRHYDATNAVFEERFAVVLESAEDRNDPSFDPRVLKVAKKGTAERAKKLSNDSKEARRKRDEVRDEFMAEQVRTWRAPDTGDPHLTNKEIYRRFGKTPFPEGTVCPGEVRYNQIMAELAREKRIPRRVNKS
jgi:hypothetical protein